MYLWRALEKTGHLDRMIFWSATGYTERRRVLMKRRREGRQALANKRAAQGEIQSVDASIAHNPRHVTVVYDLF